MLPDFQKLKERLLRVAEFDFRQRVRTGAMKGTPHFEGRRFATGDIQGHVDESTPRLAVPPTRLL
jgi:hypothetical protein